MRRFSFFILAASGWAATCTLPATKTSLAASAGTWTGSGCTGGMFVPGAGDSAIIANGVTLTIANGETWDIGSSPATHGTSAIETVSTGNVTVASGGLLKVRGPMTYTGATLTANTNWLTLNPGAAMTLITVSGTRYTAAGSASFMWRPIHSVGTSNSRITITVDATAGGVWQLGDNDQTIFMGVPGVFDYTDITGLGNASTPSFALASSYDPGGGIVGGLFTFNHSTCANCGGASGQSNTYGSGYTVECNFCSWTNTQTLYSWNIATSTATTCQIENSFIDRIVGGDGSGGSVPMAGCVIKDVVFGDTFSPSYDGSTAYDFSNLMLLSSGTAINFVFPDATHNVYWFPLHTINNPHTAAIFLNATTPTWTNVVFDMYGDTVNDTGELFGTQQTPGSPQTIVLQQAIQVPSNTGKGYAEWGTLFFNTSNTIVDILHCTLYGAGASDALQVDEGGATPNTSKWVQRAGLMWSASSSPTWYKALSVNPASPSTDSVDSDYNLGYNFTATNVSCPNCTNQANGYAVKFSAPSPGPHDVSVNPYLSNPYMSFALWDTRYLGNSYSVWSSGGTYNLGDIVQYVNAGTYRGQPVGLRCVNSNGCNGATAGSTPFSSYTFGGGLTSIVVAGGTATVTTSSALALHTGDHVYCTANGTANLCPTGFIAVTGVSGSTFTYATTASNGTYNVGTDPNLFMETWQAFWEFSSAYRLRTAVIAGTTYVDYSAGCSSACSAISTLLGWMNRSNTPQQPTLRGVTYPADPSAITNVGAAQMQAGIAFVPVVQ